MKGFVYTLALIAFTANFLNAENPERSISPLGKKCTADLAKRVAENAHKKRMGIALVNPSKAREDATTFHNICVADCKRDIAHGKPISYPDFWNAYNTRKEWEYGETPVGLLKK